MITAQELYAKFLGHAQTALAPIVEDTGTMRKLAHEIARACVQEVIDAGLVNVQRANEQAAPRLAVTHVEEALPSTPPAWAPPHLMHLYRPQNPATQPQGPVADIASTNGGMAGVPNSVTFQNRPPQVITALEHAGISVPQKLNTPTVVHAPQSQRVQSIGSLPTVVPERR